MTRTPSEKSIVEAITKFLRSHGAWVYKTHGSQYGRAGVPDLIVCYEGRFYALEVKKPEGGRVSRLQEIEIERIRKARGIATVVRSVEDARAVVMPPACDCGVADGSRCHTAYSPGNAGGHSVSCPRRDYANEFEPVLPFTERGSDGS